MDDTFNDNRYELIGKYKQKLIESTNIETSEDEMKVIDNILFRMWQIGWLDRLEKQDKKKTVKYNDDGIYWEACCPTCHKILYPYEPYCVCGQAIDWEEEE